MQLLLAHLHRVGFDRAPQPLGFDEQGREVVAYIEGAAGGAGVSDEWRSDDDLVATARMVRRFHDAAASFIPPPDAAWMRLPGLPIEGAIVCHNDLAPYNTIYRNGQPVAFIDWDTAAPAPPIWDVAHAIWRFVDISHGIEEAAVSAVAGRVRLFCDAYGLADRSNLLDTIEARQRALHETIRVLAAQGNAAFQEMWGTEHSESPLLDADFLHRHRPVFAKALTA